jgi:all-trans-retinol 13,14-reductase
MNYDVIIIGAGLGGLTAGAKLAKEGKKVFLIEQHSQPGGCATTFKRGDFTLEVGLHEMDGPSPRDMKTRIFNDLDVFNNIEFIKVPEFYRFVNGRYNVTIPHEPGLAMDRLSELFPAEKTGIKAYFDQLMNPRKRSADLAQENKSVGEYLDSIIRNDDLKLILLGNLGYFHDDPYSLSMAYYTAAQSSYYSGGASYIKGGSQKLSDYLAGYIIKHGGEVIYNHLVTGIIASNSKVTGISFRKKNDPGHSLMEASADAIVANNSVPAVSELLPVSTGSELKKEISSLRPGASLLTVYLGFSKPLKELGHRYYSTSVFDNSITSMSDIHRNNTGDFSRRSFIFVDYGQIDSELAPAGKSVGSICCVDYIKDWENLEKKEYKTRKEQVVSSFIEKLEKLIPGIKDVIKFSEAGTSATVKRYTLNPEGAVYGFAQTPSRIIFDSFKMLDNLHFASAWGKTGGGFSGAIIGGYLCAYNILRKK